MGPDARARACRGNAKPQTYLETANGDTLAIAMIETRAAQAALDDILAVEGIDGVFVGPSDFSIALSNGAKIDASNAEMLKAAAKCRAQGRTSRQDRLHALSHGRGGKARAELGFQLIALASDFTYLSAGANALVDGRRARLASLRSTTRVVVCRLRCGGDRRAVAALRCRRNRRVRRSTSAKTSSASMIGSA